MIQQNTDKWAQKDKNIQELLLDRKENQNTWKCSAFTDHCAYQPDAMLYDTTEKFLDEQDQ